MACVRLTGEVIGAKQQTRGLWPLCVCVCVCKCEQMVREFRGSTEPSTVRTARPADTLTSLTFPASRTILKVTWQVAKNKAIVSLLRIRIQGQRAAEMDALQMRALALFSLFFRLPFVVLFRAHCVCDFIHDFSCLSLSHTLSLTPANPAVRLTRPRGWEKASHRAPLWVASHAGGLYRKMICKRHRYTISEN